MRYTAGDNGHSPSRASRRVFTIPISPRRALTAVELMTTVGIAMFLILMALGPVSRSLRRGSLNGAVNTTESVILEMQNQARMRNPPALDPRHPVAAVPHYGLRVDVVGGRVVLGALYGSEPGDRLLDPDGQAVEWALPEGIELTHALAPGRSELYWFFSYGSARPIADTYDRNGDGNAWETLPTPVGYDVPTVAYQANRNIGGQASRVATELRLHTRDGRHSTQLRLHPLGMLLTDR